VVEPEFYKWSNPQILMLELVVQPGASCNEIVGLHGGRLKLRVKAIPENGQSNRALCQFLSEILKVPQSQIEILRGATSRYKTLQVSHIDPKKLENLLAQVKPSAQGQLDF
jgi:uncharacterized protein